MRADEVHREDSDAESGARTGPRHAAPKKPLLTRLHVPAGKAIALAAMPTAVLMGMGLTPTLAQAKPLPKNPFQDGPCVTQPDEPPAGEDAADSKDDGKQSEAKDDADQARPSPSPSSSASPKPSRSSRSSSPEPEPSPSESSRAGSGGLLGGLGGALGDLLTPEEKVKASAGSSPRPSASASAADKVAGTVGDTVDKVTGSAKDAADRLGDTVDEVTGKDKDGAEPSPSPSDALAPDGNGKKPFPCVTEKKSAGKDETPPVVLPDRPWRLQASSLLLQGLDYKGVVNLPTAGGKTVQVLKFTADDGIDIGDLHQLVDGPDGKTYHVQAAKGSTSTVRDGQVTLYTVSLQGNLFGVIPITFDPEHPPPINLPVAYFTNVRLTQAGQFGGNLTVPGLHQFITD